MITFILCVILFAVFFGGIAGMAGKATGENPVIGLVFSSILTFSLVGGCLIYGAYDLLPYALVVSIVVSMIAKMNAS